jgi:EF-P beta-lysylation protein EpmB
MNADWNAGPHERPRSGRLEEHSAVNRTERLSAATCAPNWHRSLAEAIRDPDELIDLLRLPECVRAPARRAAELFPLMAPRSYLARIERGNPADPLLRQILPIDAEFDHVPGFAHDALGEDKARKAPGLLQKYAGRALLIATGACAVHCRYCFRRHYPYAQEPRRFDEWEPALQAISDDASLREILLSGGDPLMLTDTRLTTLCNRLAAVEHLTRLRIHTRLPIVLPDRITPELIELLTGSRLTPIVVVHANHPNEIVADCTEALRTLVRSGITVLNQSVLLRGVNDSVEAVAELSERLIDLGVIPYYLHQLDRVAGVAHFEVAEERGRAIVEELRRRLPGYAVPQYVREVPGAAYKVPLG